MSMRDRGWLPLLVVLGTLGVVAHLVIGTWSVFVASRWLGWTLAAVMVVVVTAAHVIGLRQLARRRRAATVVNNARTDQ